MEILHVELLRYCLYILISIKSLLVYLLIDIFMGFMFRDQTNDTSQSILSFPVLETYKITYQISHYICPKKKNVMCLYNYTTTFKDFISLISFHHHLTLPKYLHSKFVKNLPCYCTNYFHCLFNKHVFSSVSPVTYRNLNSDWTQTQNRGS